MASVGDVFQLRSKITIHGIDCFNVWWYQVISVSPDGTKLAQQIRDMFKSQTIPLLRALMSTESYFSYLSCVNWSDVLDYSEQSYASDVYPGTVIGNALPPSTAYFIRFSRPSLAYNNGGKRLSGFAVDTADEMLLAGGYSDELAALITHITSQVGLSNGAVRQFVPQRMLNGVNIFPAMGTGVPSGYQVSNASGIRFSTQRSRLD